MATAYPVVVPGSPGSAQTLLMLVASDSPIDCFDDLQHVLSGSVLTGQLAVQMLDWIAAWEIPKSKTTNVVKSLLAERLCSFIDLYPWPLEEHKDLNFLLPRHREYLMQTKPLVVLSFSKWVCKLAHISNDAFSERSTLGTSNDLNYTVASACRMMYEPGCRLQVQVTLTSSYHVTVRDSRAASHLSCNTRIRRSSL